MNKTVIDSAELRKLREENKAMRALIKVAVNLDLDDHPAVSTYREAMMKLSDEALSK
jgi:hypothetical protein